MSVRWTDAQIRKIRKLHAQGHSVQQMALTLGRGKTSIYNMLGRLGLATTPPAKVYVSYKNEPATNITPADKHTADGTYGRINALALAERELASYFTTHCGMRYYKGKRITGFREWHKIIEDLNVHLIEHGKSPIEWRL